MGLFIKQNENRSQLQERLAAELRERARTQATGSGPIDQTKQSNYVKDSEEVSGKVLFLVLLSISIVVAVVAYLIIF